MQNEDFTWKFRVAPHLIAEEINKTKLIDRAINSGHVRASVEIVILWQERFNAPIHLKETMEVEQIRENGIKLTYENQALKEKVALLETALQQAKQKAADNGVSATEFSRLKDRLSKARAILVD